MDRDAVAVLNMLRKTTPTVWVKDVWWDLRDVKERLEKGGGLVPRDFAKRRNPLVPWPLARAAWTSLKTLRAGDKWPAVLARAAPMTPARGADEDGARAPPHGAPALGKRSDVPSRASPTPEQGPVRSNPNANFVKVANRVATGSLEGRKAAPIRAPTAKPHKSSCGRSTVCYFMLLE